MKKFIALMLSFSALLMLFACGAGNESGSDKKELNEVTLTLGVVDGAPSLAVTNVLADGFTYVDGNTEYTLEVELVGGAPDIRAGLINGSYDLAIAPLNLAAAIYNAKPELGIKLASVNIFGCLYMIGDNAIEDLSKLKGKTVISVGAGGTPDVVLRNLLGKNGIGINAEGENDGEKVTITYADDSTGVVQALSKGEADFAILGEPAVTTLSNRLGKCVALDMQAEWKKAYGDVNFVQAGLFVTGNVSSSLTKAIVSKLSENADYVNDNIDKLTEIFTSANSTLKSTAFSQALIERCNIGCRGASEVKEDVVRFLTAVYEYNASQVGGKLPSDEFYI